jgi:hypothetical protein
VEGERGKERGCRRERASRSEQERAGHGQHLVYLASVGQERLILFRQPQNSHAAAQHTPFSRRTAHCTGRRSGNERAAVSGWSGWSGCRASMLAFALARRLALVRAVGVAAVAAWQPGVPGPSVHGRVDSAWAVGGVVFVVAIHSVASTSSCVSLRLAASRCVFLHSRCFRPRLRFSHSPSLPSLPACRLPPAALAVLSPSTGRWYHLSLGSAPCHGNGRPRQ